MDFDEIDVDGDAHFVCPQCGHSDHWTEFEPKEDFADCLECPECNYNNLGM